MMPTLAVGPDDILYLTQLARAFQAGDAMNLAEPTDSLSEDLEEATGATSNEDHASTLEEFRAVVDDLEPDQQMQLVALLWIGRGDYSSEDWDQALEDARDAWNPRTADYLISHPLLADDIEEGLRALGYDLE